MVDLVGLFQFPPRLVTGPPEQRPVGLGRLKNHRPVMNAKQKEEMQKFSKLAAEGRGFLLELHCPFRLPGETSGREVMFFGGLELIKRWERELNEGKFEKERKNFAAQRREATTVFRTLLDLVKANLTAEAAVAKLKKVGELGKGWEKFPQALAELSKNDSEMRELLQTLFQFGELRFASLGRQLAAADQVTDAFKLLGEAAIDRGDEYAIERLVDLANYGVTLLEALAEKRPKLVKKHARQRVQWPVQAGVEPDWPIAAQKYALEVLELGEDTLHGHLDKSKAYNLQIVARRYARGIVETLEMNRCCAALVPTAMEIIRRKEKRDGFKVLVKRVPSWVTEAVSLEPFSRESAERWLAVGIKMLKQQRPHLPQQEDWKRIKTHWENRGDNKTPGRMWGSIKDALRSPIKTIARTRKSEKLTQKAPTDLGNPKSSPNKA